MYRAIGPELGELRAAQPLSAEDENRQLVEARLAAQVADHLVAAHPRHVLVEEDQGGALLPYDIDGLRAVGSGERLKTEFLEDVTHQRENRAVVVNDEDDWLFTHCRTDSLEFAVYDN